MASLITTTAKCCSREQINVKKCGFCENLRCVPCMKTADSLLKGICRKCELSGVESCVENCGKFVLEKCEECKASCCRDCAYFGEDGEWDCYLCKKCSGTLTDDDDE